jgi:hypothetical protein
MLPTRVGAVARGGAYSLHADLWRGRTGRGAGGWVCLGHVVRRTSGGRARVCARPRLAILAAAGVDLHANAVELQVRGRSLLRSGRMVPLLRLGLAWRSW